MSDLLVRLRIDAQGQAAVVETARVEKAVERLAPAGRKAKAGLDEAATAAAALGAAAKGAEAATKGAADKGLAPLDKGARGAKAGLDQAAGAAENAAAKVRAVEAAANTAAEKGLATIDRAARGAKAGLDQASSGADNLEHQVHSVEAATKGAVDRGLQPLDRAGRSAKSGLDQAAAGARNLEQRTRGAEAAVRGAAAALGFMGLREVIIGLKDAAQASAGFELGLGAVTGGAAQASSELAFVRDEALRLGIGVRGASASFLDLAASTNGTRVAGDATREVWLGVAEAGLALGRSNEQVGRGLTAIGQIAGKGVVSMEEIRQQLAEAIPGATVLAARAMGMTTAEFNKTVAAGNLLAEDFLPRFGAQLRAEFGPAIEAYLNTPLGKARVEMGRTETAIFDLSAAGGEAFLAGVIGGLTGLNDSLTSAEVIENVRTLGRELGELAGGAAKAVGFLAKHADEAAVVLSTLLGLRVGATLAGWALEARAAAGAMGLLGASVTGLGAAAGPLGLLLGGAVAGGIAYFALEAAKAEENAAGLQSAIDQADTALKSAADAGRDAGDAFGDHAGMTDQLGVAMRSVKGDVDDLTESLIIQAEKARAAQIASLEAARSSLWAQVTTAKKEETRYVDSKISLSAMFGGGDMGAGVLASYGALTSAKSPAAPKMDDAQDRLVKLNAELARAQNLPTASLAQGLSTPDSASSGGSTKKTGRARKTDAERQAEDLKEFRVQLELETAALLKEAEAAALGEEALERQRVTQAGLDVLRREGVKTLGELTPANQALAKAAMEAAEAKERQAIATEKAGRVADSLRDLESRISAERGLAEAIGAGTAAEVAYTKAEFVRQEVERAGKTLSAEQIDAIKRKAEALFEAQAVTEQLQDSRAYQEELRLASMTADEREREVRALQLKKQLLAGGADDASAEAQARTRAADEQSQLRQAKEVGDLKEGIRQAWIEGGELGIDSIGDYAERKFREAIFDSFLKKPIDVVINAVVGNGGSLQSQISGLFNGGGGGGGGGQGAGGFGKMLSSFFGGGAPGGGDAASLLSDVVVTPMKQISGLSGPMASLSSSMSGMSSMLSSVAGPIGMMYAASQLGSQGSSALVGMFGGDKGQQKRASQVGAWTGILPGTIAGLMDNGERPYARSDISLSGGRFVVSGGDSLDDGPSNEINQVGATVAASLNQFADALDLDLKRITGLGTSVGHVEGKKTGQLGQGYFGGEGGSFSGGAAITGVKSAEQLAQDVVKETILRAVAAGAGKFTEAEKRFLQAADDLDAAAQTLKSARNFASSIDDAILQLTDPAGFERKAALDAVEESYNALKSQAEELVAAGLVTGDVFAKIEQLHQLKLDDTFKKLADTVEKTVDVFAEARPKLQAWLDGLANSAASPLNPFEQRGAAYASYERLLEKARGADAGALSSITGYADQLLSADKAATPNAQDRLSLYSKVRSDIEGLAYMAPPEISAAVGAAGTQITQAIAAQSQVLSADLVQVQQDLQTGLSQLAQSTEAGLMALAEQIISQTGMAAQGVASSEMLAAQLRQMFARGQ